MIVIYHSRDLDGWCSGAIVQKWFYQQSYRNDTLKMIGWDYADPIPDISKNEEVVMVDISFPTKDMMRLVQDNNLVWIDHHISAMKAMEIEGFDPHGLRDVNFSACELAWKYFFGTKLPEFVRLLGRYDCFGHRGTSEEQEVLEFQYAARSYYKNPEDCFMALSENPTSPAWVNVDYLKNIGKGIYKYLRTEAEQEYKKIFSVKISNYKFAVANKCRLNPINFGIDYHKDGYDGFMCFWYESGKWYFSLYNGNGEVDCSVICKQFGGGGHKGAAGFTSNDLDFLFTYSCHEQI